MLYREYGKTGLQVSAIGMGGMRFADSDDIEANALLVRAAYDSGVNYFDTAPGYCADKSEDALGTAFKQMKAESKDRPFYTATKTFADNPDRLTRELERSLERLNVDCIDFYHMWCILEVGEFERRRKGGTLDAMEKAREQGLIRNICVSSHMTGGDIGKVLKDYDFEGVLLGYSAMNYAYREKAIEEAAELGRGVVVMNPLGGGLIPQNPEKFGFVRTRDDETVVEGALRFLLNDERITVSLVGFSEQSHIDEAVSAVDGFEPIADEKLAGIRENMRDSFDQLCTACRYCEKCNQDIPVPKFMDAYNHYILTGDSDMIVKRLRFHWGINIEDEYLDKCTECGLCEKACTQKLPVVERLRFIREEIEKARQVQS